MNEVETWKDIPGYEGHYQVSDLGRVKALARQKRNKGGYFWIGESMKRPYPQSDGYLQVGLSRDGKKKSYLLHRLVGIAFIPGDTSLEINHKDFVRTNCRADNLEWATHVDNVDYSLKNGRFEFKEQRGLTKLKKSDVIEIRTLSGLIARKVLAKRYGVTVPSIGQVQLGNSWKHVA